MKHFLTATIAFACLSPLTLHADDDHTPLADQMEIVNDSYKAMRRTDDAKEGAKLAREAQSAVLKAFTMTPEMVEKGNHPDAPEKAMAGYRTQIAELLVVLCQVEQAFVAEDLEKVKELVRPLRESKKKGHDSFMEDE